MNNVNGLIFTIIYLIEKLAKNYIDNAKNDIKNGAKVTFNNKFARIHVESVTPSKKVYSAEEQEKLDKFIATLHPIEQPKTKRVEVDDIAEIATNIAGNTFTTMLETLQQDSNKWLAKAAAKVMAKMQ